MQRCRDKISLLGGLFWDAARVAGEDLVRDPIVSQSTMGLKFLCDDILTFMPNSSASTKNVLKVF